MTLSEKIPALFYFFRFFKHVQANEVEEFSITSITKTFPSSLVKTPNFTIVYKLVTSKSRLNNTLI